MHDLNFNFAIEKRVIIHERPFLMGNLKAIVIVALFFFVFQNSQAQESPGVTQGNFAGSMMMRLNPSTMIQSKVYMDINILSVTAFGQNDFAYLPGKDVRMIPLLMGKDSLPSYPPSGNNFLYFGNKIPKTASALVNVYGLSGMVEINDQVFGFYTAFRSYTSGRNLPYEIPIFGSESLGYTPLHNINFDDNEFSAGTMSWAEIGLSYSRTLVQQGNHHWTLGATAKVLQGAAATFLKASNANYMVLNRNTIQIYDMNVDAGFSLPLDYQSNDLLLNPLFKGSGFGLDLGVTYTYRVEGFQNNHSERICEEPYHDYFWRLGFSILDLGAIKFNKNTELHQFNNVNALLEDIDKMNFLNLDQMTSELSTRLLGDADASYIGDEFRLGLPTAFSAQLDVHVSSEWYVNAIIVHPFSASKYTVRRPAEIILTPRFETDWFELMMPVSLYEYTQTRVGLAMRIGVFTLGTDQLLSVLGWGNVKGLDIYAGVKINFRKGICLFGNDNGACSTDYGFKPRRNALKKLNSFFR